MPSISHVDAPLHEKNTQLDTMRLNQQLGQKCKHDSKHTGGQAHTTNVT